MKLDISPQEEKVSVWLYAMRSAAMNPSASLDPTVAASFADRILEEVIERADRWQEENGAKVSHPRKKKNFAEEIDRKIEGGEIK